MISRPKFFVAYADILGFKNLVLSNRAPRAGSLDHRQRAGWWHKDNINDMYNPVRMGFTSFHKCFDKAIAKIPWKLEATVMVFSDSLFVATPSGEDCMLFCETFSRYCIESDVPLRTGVGHGIFVTHGFAFESTPKLKVISSQFLGSAVIRAVQAERILKGPRIGLHPRALKALKEAKVEDVKLVPLPKDQGFDKDGKRILTHEWSLLSSAGEMGGINDEDFVDQEDRLLKHLRLMMKTSAKKEHVHYEQAIEALKKMVKLRNSWIPDADERERDWPAPEEPES